jgi:hypothetical protein
MGVCFVSLRLVRMCSCALGWVNVSTSLLSLRGQTRHIAEPSVCRLRHVKTVRAPLLRLLTFAEFGAPIKCSLSLALTFAPTFTPTPHPLHVNSGIFPLHDGVATILNRASFHDRVATIINRVALHYYCREALHYYYREALHYYYREALHVPCYLGSSPAPPKRG